jgi:hypothetical protein
METPRSEGEALFFGYSTEVAQMTQFHGIRVYQDAISISDICQQNKRCYFLFERLSNGA